eukprot:1148937-Pelagomonas_calceolata.AAC.5
MESNSRATAAVMDLRQHSNVAGTAEGSRILETIAYLRPWRALAGAVSRTSTAPMDRLKMIMQIEDVSKKGMTIKEGIARMQAEGSALKGTVAEYCTAGLLLFLGISVERVSVVLLLKCSCGIQHSRMCYEAEIWALIISAQDCVRQLSLNGSPFIFDRSV